MEVFLGIVFGIAIIIMAICNFDKSDRGDFLNWGRGAGGRFTSSAVLYIRLNRNLYSAPKKCVVFPKSPIG